MSLFTPTPPPKDQIWPVSDLNSRIKNLLENSIGEVWVRGEISNLRYQSSGHIYFSLKDDRGQMNAVCFRRDAAQLTMKLRDGMEVIGFGRVSVYEPRGTYQVILNFILEDGLGKMQQRFEALKAKLSTEGLFSPDRKKPIPALPQTIGFVTSPSGAALRDFVSILKRRQWNGKLIVIPARVQGNEAASEIIKGIQIANTNKLCDLLVIGRGGGSLEDLWPFNEEAVVRAVAASELPIISAVGHEIDFVLSDFAADKRAETPSAAAELITSAFVNLRDRFRHSQKNIQQLTQNALLSHRQEFNLVKSRLREFHPTRVLENALLRIDDARSRLKDAIQNRISQQNRHLQDLTMRFHRKDLQNQIQFYRERLNQIGRRLQNSSHEATLKRGYTITLDANSKIVSSSASLTNLDAVQIRFHDGTRQAEIKS